MNTVRKILGIIWVALALAIAYFGFTVLGYPKLISGKQDDLVFGIIIVFILLPIVVGGLLVFGKYALQNEYDIYDDAPDHAHYKE
jgi:membrane protease YdiL (CAAX protease family)